MKSPFYHIRKNQKTLLAAVTLMAIFTFVLGDSLLKLLQGNTVNDKVVLTTTEGELKRSGMDYLKQRRSIANQFIARAAAACEIPFQNVQQVQFSFGYVGQEFEKDILMGYLLSLEAEKIGVIISDDTVSDFISQFTQEKLSQNSFREIVREMNVGQQVLYDSLRGELQARTAFRLLMPFDPFTPEQYWEIYKKMNIKQSMDVAPIMVDSFVKDVPDPQESALREFFEEYKTKEENSSEEEFSPGFKQPRKVNLQYLALRFADFREKMEKSKPVTDQEIEDYYAKNLDQYMILDMPSQDFPELPDASDLDKLLSPPGGADSKPKTDDPSKSEEKKTEAPAAPVEKSETEGAHKTEATPDNPSDTDEKPEPAKEETFSRSAC